nr:MAG TPA: hypothetical protein [Caudoviricetes sp.]
MECWCAGRRPRVHRRAPGAGRQPPWQHVTPVSQFAKDAPQPPFKMKEGGHSK